MFFHFSENGEEDDDDDEDIGNEDLGHNDYEKVHDDPTDDTGDDPIWYWLLFMNSELSKKPDIHQAVITNIFWLCHII